MAETRGPELVTLLIIFLALAWIFTALRVYVRRFVTKNWGIDDTMLVAALMSYNAYCGFGVAGIVYGTGRHVSDIKREDLPKALEFWWICELFYTLTTVLIRLSIAVFLLRICDRKLHKYIIYVTMAAVLIFSVFYFILAIFQCQPISFFWEQASGGEGTCIPKEVFPDATYAHSAVSATADWILGLLPVWLVWNLQMNFRTKVSVGLVLSLGMLAGIAALIRVPFIRVLAITDDFLFATADVAIWSTIEPSLGITATAACVLRPLFKRFYDLSTYGTGHSRHLATNPTHRRGGGGTHKKGPLSTTPSSNSSIGYKSDMSGKDDLELGFHGKNVTSVQTHIRGGKSHLSMNKELPVPRRNTSFSSETELTGKGGIQIHVQRTTEINRHDIDGGSPRDSTDMRLPAPWPGHNPN